MNQQIWSSSDSDCESRCSGSDCSEIKDDALEAMEAKMLSWLITPEQRFGREQNRRTARNKKHHWCCPRRRDLIDRQRPQQFQIGQLVQVRLFGMRWREGSVTQLSPLKVHV